MKKKICPLYFEFYLSLSLAFLKAIEYLDWKISFTECVLEIRDFLGNFFFEKGPKVFTAYLKVC